MDGFAQAFCRCAGHFGLQLIEGYSQIMRDMHGSDKLAQILEPLGGLLQVCAGRQQALELAGQFGIVGKPLGNAGLLFARATVGIMIGRMA